MTLPQDVFDAWSALCQAKDRLDEAVDVWVPALACDYDDITFDYYDASFEVKGCADELRIPDVSIPKIRSAGFERVWLCHRNGAETFYEIGRDPHARKGFP
jgi:hypothetical protein